MMSFIDSTFLSKNKNSRILRRGNVVGEPRFPSYKMHIKFKIPIKTPGILCAIGSALLLFAINYTTRYNVFYWTMRCLFYRIRVPSRDNTLLYPKIQTFIKNYSYGGNDLIIDNGKNYIKTGWLITLKPFSIININNNVDCNYIKNHDNVENTIQPHVPLYVDIFMNKISKQPQSFVNFLNGLDVSINTSRVYNMSTINGQPHWHITKLFDQQKQPLLYTKDVIHNIESKIDTFLNSRTIYNKYGKNYKITMVFYGPTGTGKTSFVKHLAIKYKRDVYIIDPSNIGDFQRFVVSSSVLKTCEGNILLFEDIDSYFLSLYSREEKPNISNFLNFLDGLCTPENIIIVMTANYKGNIPDNIKRDGRIDHMVYFPYLNNEIMHTITSLYEVDPDKIKVEGLLTTSEFIKHIEINLDKLRGGDISKTSEILTIVGANQTTNMQKTLSSSMLTMNNINCDKTQIPTFNKGVNLIDKIDKSEIDCMSVTY